MTQDQPVAQNIRRHIEEKPGAMTVELARELGVPEVEVIRNLPEGMSAEAPADHFESIWNRLTKWEKATFICVAPGCVIEVSGPLPKGGMGHGMFNIRQTGTPLGGHLMVDDLESIWLVSRPFFGKESHSVQFFSNDGNAMFSVYVGRDEERELIGSARQDFLSMKEEYANNEG